MYRQFGEGTVKLPSYRFLEETHDGSNKTSRIDRQHTKASFKDKQTYTVRIVALRM